MLGRLGGQELVGGSGGATPLGDRPHLRQTRQGNKADRAVEALAEQEARQHMSDEASGWCVCPWQRGSGGDLQLTR